MLTSRELSSGTAAASLWVSTVPTGSFSLAFLILILKILLKNLVFCCPLICTPQSSGDHVLGLLWMSYVHFCLSHLYMLSLLLAQILVELLDLAQIVPSPAPAKLLQHLVYGTYLTSKLAFLFNCPFHIILPPQVNCKIAGAQKHLFAILGMWKKPTFWHQTEFWAQKQVCMRLKTQRLGAQVLETHSLNSHPSFIIWQL